MLLGPLNRGTGRPCAVSGTGTDLLYILTLPRDCLGEGAGPVRLRMGRLPRLKITLCCSWACFVSRRGSGGEAGLLLQGPG